MPINFLHSIKSTAFQWPSIESQSTLCAKINKQLIFDLHFFPCQQLGTSQALFNDGVPSIILMPRKTDQVNLRKGKELIKLKSAWICCGTIENTHWQIPKNVENILVLRFQPADFYSLFNINPAVFLTNPICNLENLMSEKWVSIFQAIYQQEIDWKQLNELNERLVVEKSESRFPAILSAAIKHIENRKGAVNVADVLQHLGSGVNSKWLYRNFVNYIGIPPKKYIALQRFIYGYQEYKNNKNAVNAELANLQGYYDYNHFLKDFKRYIGIAPTQYHFD